MTETSVRMSRVDTAWLRMDREHNLMMIVGVWLLRPAIGYEALCAHLTSRLLCYRRFRQKVVQETVLSYWVDDEDFDIRHHVVRERLVRRRGQSERAALQARASELAATPLDHAHPLWQMHLIEHYEDGSAMIVRIHHCIADGIALNTVLMSTADGGTGLPEPAKDQAHDAHEGDWLSDAVVRPLTDLTVAAIGMYGDGIVKGLEYLEHPQPLADSMDLARTGGRILRDAAALALLPDDSPTLLKGKLNGKKVVAWCEPLPLDQVKAVGKALNCSVNDVLLSCVAGSIGRYLSDRGDDPTGKEIGESAAARTGLAAGQSFRPGAAGVADRHRQPGRARLRGARAHAGAQGQLPAVAGLWHSGGVGSVDEVAAGCAVRPVPEQDHGGDDQRAGSGQGARVLRQHPAAEHLLGAVVGRRRRRREHRVVCRRRAVRPDRRQSALPRPAEDHRSLRARVREPAAADADAALGEGGEQGHAAGGRNVGRCTIK
jgi:Wax ester synthase-like Acyl-CoA acyltransferase domain